MIIIMSDIKSVIISLCEVFHNVMSLDVHAENLRLAKFNKSERNTVGIIWKVLHKLCCLSAYKENGGSCIGDQDLAACVKLCLTSCHYDNFNFYCLPHDMSSGSRELLLALGWLLAETRILEIRILDYVKKQLFNDIVTSQSAKENNLITANYDIQEVLTDKELCHQIMWLAGRIKQNLKGISCMTSEKFTLLSKLQGASKDAYNLPFLTVEQISLLKDKQMCLKKEDAIQNVKTVLENYFYFIEHDKVFWNWMESVLVVNEDTFEGNMNDFNKYMEMLKGNVKDVILKETSQDFNEIFANLESEFRKCAYSCNGKDVVNFLATLNERYDQMNSLYKSNICEINEYLEKVKSNCES